MGKRGSFRLWLWWLLPVMALAVLGFYLFSEKVQEQEKELLTEKVFPVETKGLLEEQQGDDDEKEEILAGSVGLKTTPELLPEEDPCIQIEKNVAGFFSYLDGKKYIRYLDPETDTYALFKKILKQLAARHPVPAGEGIDPEIIIRNITHFFRVLDRKDLHLIKEIIANEQDSIEMDLQMFHKWFTLNGRCPDPEGLRPSMETLYQYAGFFLNTTGGKAYLFRRTSAIRILFNYYCILIIHEADKIGKNIYGLDIFPHIAPLKQELTHYPGFEFQQDYIDQLNWIERYYMQKR